MASFSVVKGEVFGQSDGELCHVAVALQVHVLILHVAPEPFHEDVIQGSATSVHANFDVFAFQNVGECRARELRALVAVKDLWLAVGSQCVLQTML